jgi:hypothetical protein
VRITLVIDDMDINKLHVQKLVDGFKMSLNAHVILQLHRYFLSNKSLKKRIKKLQVDQKMKRIFKQVPSVND